MMFKATLKSLLARKLRLLLSGLAVVLGVMAVSGALVLTDNLGRSFDALFQTVNQNLDVQVSGTQNVQGAEQDGEPVTRPIPATLVGTFAAVPGVRSAIGAVIVDGARVIGPDGKVIGSTGPPRFGVGWRGEVGFTQLRTGRGPQAPDEIAIDAGLAKQGHFQVGDRVGVLTLQPKRTFTLVGIFGYTGGRDSLGGETRVAFTEPVAQQLMLGRQGVYSVINVQAQQGTHAGELRDAIQARLGGGYLVRTRQQVADDQASDVEGFLGFIRAFLLGFAAVALFVGVFLILNTFSILVAQRTRELALLRALDAGRGQVLRSVLVEAVVGRAAGRHPGPGRRPEGRGRAAGGHGGPERGAVPRRRADPARRRDRRIVSGRRARDRGRGAAAGAAGLAGGADGGHAGCRHIR
jgi:putative ABC transport system permease protein